MLTTPPITEVAGHLRLVVARTARRLRQEGGADLSPSLSSALAAVERHGPVTPSELADHERVQRPTATRVIARLEELGLVERAVDPADPRSCLITARPHRPPWGPEGAAPPGAAPAILERMLDEEGRR